MTERRLERSAVHRGDLILVNAQLPFAGPEEQDRVCLDANVMLRAGRRSRCAAWCGRWAAGPCWRLSADGARSGSSRRFTRVLCVRTGGLLPSSSWPSPDTVSIRRGWPLTWDRQGRIWILFARTFPIAVFVRNFAAGRWLWLCGTVSGRQGICDRHCP